MASAPANEGGLLSAMQWSRMRTAPSANPRHDPNLDAHNPTYLSFLGSVWSTFPSLPFLSNADPNPNPNPNPDPSPRRFRMLEMMGVLIVVFTSLLLVLAAAQVSSTTDTHTKTLRPVNLRAVLRAASMRAKREGALQPISTTWEVVPTQASPHHTSGLGFVVSLKDASSSSSKDNSSTVKTPGTSPFDPFSPSHLDPRLVVSPIPPLHTLILNKYNTLSDHALLITNAFESQTSQLSIEDLDALFFCLRETTGLGFFNSAWEAGASQAHKHMQVIPLDVLYNIKTPPLLALLSTPTYANIPAYNPLAKVKGTNSPPDPNLHPRHVGGADALFNISLFDFPHAIVKLTSEQDWDTFTHHQMHSYALGPPPSYAQYLYTSYNALLKACGIDAGHRHLRTQILTQTDTRSLSGTGVLQAHNLILTQKHMMVVPRSARLYKDVVDVNALGFVGLLLAPTPTALQLIKADGPIQVLKGVVG